MRSNATRWMVVLALAAAVLPSRAAAPDGRYIVSSGTVYDTVTGLTWEREPIPQQPYNLANAQSYCQNLELEGSGWRIPRIKELQTLVDVRAESPSWDTSVFPATSVGTYWSSTPHAARSDYWGLWFKNGETISMSAGSVIYLRCVR